MALLAVGILVAEWAAILRNCTAAFGERTFPGPYDQLCSNVDQYTWPPVTILAALFGLLGCHNSGTTTLRAAILKLRQRAPALSYAHLSCSDALTCHGTITGQILR